MPSRLCGACAIKFPNEREYTKCLACEQGTTYSPYSAPHRDFKHKAFESYWTIREVKKPNEIAEA